jgi:hypothetical protein
MLVSLADQAKFLQRRHLDGAEAESWMRLTCPKPLSEAAMDRCRSGERIRISLGMVTFRSDTCDKCKNANPIGYRVEPAEAWRTVVLNRWRRLCPGCFDVAAE